MLNREALQFLNRWKEKPDRKPLVIWGARQVGKTTLVNIFSKKFRQYIYLNLELTEERKIFDDRQNFEEVIDALFFLKNGGKNVPDTLIFIDEIQNSPEAVKNLRYFYEKKKELAVVTAGSLLETLIDKDITYPVGRVEFFALRPFSFHEYLNAVGEKNSLDAIDNIPFPEYAHNKLISLFRRYALIGGMPEVIKKYSENNDLNEIKEVIKNLVLSYKADIEKYARNETVNRIVRHIIDNAFHFAGERIKFNRFANSNYRSREVSECFRILEKTMLLQLVYPATSTGLPLIADKKKSPKLQLLDTGLVNFMSGIEKDVYNTDELTDVYRGKIAEHIIGQELLAREILPENNLLFWLREKKQSDAKLDYLITYKGNVIPVEVKSGSAGKLRSLHQFINLSTVKNKLTVAVRFYAGKLSVKKETTPEGNKFILLNLPFYLCNKIGDYIDWAAGRVNSNE
ncbi:MAG: AAA family ATPase [Melioribacteraceae bacterium]